MVIEKIKINKNNRNDEGNVQNCVKNKENKKKMCLSFLFVLLCFHFGKSSHAAFFKSSRIFFCSLFFLLLLFYNTIQYGNETSFLFFFFLKWVFSPHFSWLISLSYQQVTAIFLIRHSESSIYYYHHITSQTFLSVILKFSYHLYIYIYTGIYILDVHWPVIVKVITTYSMYFYSISLSLFPTFSCFFLILYALYFLFSISTQHINK